MAVLFSPVTAEIRKTKVRSDARTILAFDGFGFTHTGVLELNASGISLSDSNPDLDFSQLGFILSTGDAWIHVMQQIQELDVSCALQSELLKGSGCSMEFEGSSVMVATSLDLPAIFLSGDRSSKHRFYTFNL